MRSGEKAYFDRIASVFDSELNVYSSATGALRVKRRIGLFAGHCGLKPGSRILEIGCGTGEYSRYLSKLGIRLFITDLSHNMLDIARKKISGSGGEADYFISDIEHLPVLNRSLDAVLGNSVLHHLDAGRALGEIYRVLRNGGKLAFSEPNMLNPQIFLQKKIKFIKRLSGDSPGETAFYRWKLKKTLRDAGFRNILIKPFDFLHPATPPALAGAADRIGLFFEKTPFKEIAGSLIITAEK